MNGTQVRYDDYDFRRWDKMERGFLGLLGFSPRGFDRVILL